MADNSGESDDDVMPEAGKIPALYVDGTYAVWWKDHIRISFSESVANEQNWRVAVVMELRAVKRMIRLLNEVIGDMEKEEAKDAESK